MERVPPVDRELDDRDVDEADHGHDGGGAGASLRLLNRSPQRDQREEISSSTSIEVTRIPDPIGAPHRLAPERPT